jgi:S-methylmethionine-dependent homocysteine/selenocysteine methylase
MAHVTVLDGGMGRELERVGAPFRQPEWSALALLESPDHVRQVHESYVAAGAEVITTNAYALVPYHLGAERFEADGRRLAALAGQIAREVAGAHPGVRVAGCLPPVLGSYQPQLFVREEARPILDVLVLEQAPFVDLWLAETQSSIAEAGFVRDVLDAHLQTAPLWISYTLHDELVEDEPRLRSGESVTDAAHAADHLGAQVVAFNCSQPEVMEPAVREAAAATSIAIGVYANAFVPGDDGDANGSLHDIRQDVTPETYLDWAKRWVAAGASVVGGCCGIGPEHVSALSAHLKGS